MDRDYTVFISHAGPDKSSLASPLYERLRQRNMNVFLDREELRAGDNGPIVMKYAMDTAPIGVFILSPEFPARSWTMRELLCFQQREESAIMNGMPVPKLIPVFYRLTVRQCRDPSMFYMKNEQGENYFYEEKFFDRAARGNITIQKVAESMKLLAFRTGIENTAKATNEDTQEMDRKRAALLDRIVDAVVEAANKVKHSDNEDLAVSYWRRTNTDSPAIRAPQPP